jgi:hypothetical protein
MTTSLVDAESVLAIDIGSQATRALLFDVVDGQYSFIASGKAPTTLQAPFRDVGEGMSGAVLRLQAVTGRTLLAREGQIQIPASNGAGVDRLVLTYSAGPQVRMVVAGLLGDVSIASAQRLVGATYGQILETLGLNDRRPPADQIDAILKASPDVILVAGGTEGGASRSVYKLVDLVNLACRMLPQGQRPEVIYCGNQDLARRIKDNLEKWTRVEVVPNIRPSIDAENLAPAEQALHQAVTRLRLQRIHGLSALAAMASAPPLGSAQAFGRLVRFLSNALNPSKGVLGVDLGNASTVVAAGFAGSLLTTVFPYGMGRGAETVLNQSKLADIQRWLPIPLPDTFLRDVLWQKTLNPDLLPQDAETLAVEMAFARHILRLAVQQFQARFPEAERPYEPILASGGLLSQAATPGQTLLALLDGLQPLGVTTFVLDQNCVAPSLGAVAGLAPILPVQLIESGAFLSLGTVISPLTQSRFNTPVVRARVEYDQGEAATLTVNQGSVTVLPVQTGQAARVSLQGLNGALIDPFQRKKSLTFKVVGGACGVVIDARGRPVALPPDDARRRDLMKKWSLSLGG